MVQLVAEADLAELVRPLGWERQGRGLVKVVRRHDFATALAYVNEVGRLAERAGHHPDVDIRWSTVTLHLTTHSLGGITDADLELAGQIDALP